MAQSNWRRLCVSGTSFGMHQRKTYATLENNAHQVLLFKIGMEYRSFGFADSVNQGDKYVREISLDSKIGKALNHNAFCPPETRN
jgi:hypothetical protein